MRYSGSILAFTLLIGTSAAAQQAQPAKSPGDVIVTGERPREKKICTRIVPTGSIMPQTICKTPEEIEYDRARGLALIERLRNERTADQQLKGNRDTAGER